MINFFLIEEIFQIQSRYQNDGRIRTFEERFEERAQVR